jgi:hypothetical protein
MCQSIRTTGSRSSARGERDSCRDVGLPVPLTGPVIFVSHGGEAFPSLTVVLQDDGVTIGLVSATFITKAGITSTGLKTVPDDPVSTFELTLGQGPYSASSPWRRRRFIA